ncbi:hypothetical protein K431DRAFT_345160 [Polychaeton citri CBS 116435]|uniref:Protein kinase domain-containing protein n=1 Tax=Polychaeton citri CBS 116435 TaxID=1314669 RepID=A0A9P4URN1_9PEZI|nr:hypothetical protein K431DRAFT_345160 [Polychaeton citri CBS 116435]
MDKNEVVVIKAFTTIPRNRLLESLCLSFTLFTSTWPAETEATYPLTNGTGCVYLRDYFILQQPPTISNRPTWSWAMVTPFIVSGSLLDLAAKVASKHKTTDEVDHVFRPVFGQFLSYFNALHVAGLCHNNITPSSIFVTSPSQWLIGDLGNVRHISHDWHTTQDWKGRYLKKSDCTSRDVLRAMKSYLYFLK